MLSFTISSQRKGNIRNAANFEVKIIFGFLIIFKIKNHALIFLNIKKFTHSRNKLERPGPQLFVRL